MLKSNHTDKKTTIQNKQNKTNKKQTHLREKSKIFKGTIIDRR